MSSELSGQNDIVKYQEMLDINLERAYTVFQQRFILNQKVVQQLYEGNNLKLVNDLKAKYIADMKQLLIENRNISAEDLYCHHNESKGEAVLTFVASRIDGDQSFDKYLRNLNESINEFYDLYKLSLEKRGFSWLEFIKEVGQIVLDFVPILSPFLKAPFFGGRRNRRQRR